MKMASEEIQNVIAWASYYSQLHRVSVMQKWASPRRIEIERAELLRWWERVKPTTCHKTRPAYEWLNSNAPYTECRKVALYGRLPKGYENWVQ